MLNLLSAGKRIIYVDETWLPKTDFRRMKWHARGMSNSVVVKDMSQRVNMITALDTNGEVYLSLNQLNTDTNVMLMFLSRLATRLTQADVNWR